MKRELTVKEIQDISFEILKIVAGVCEQLHLRYFLFYGTLIGAVRHRDYIPWDDDLDIMMPRPDYDKLLLNFAEYTSEYEYLRLFNHDTNRDYPYMITRVSDDRYHIVMDNETEYGMGVFIDIYPFDGLGNTKEEALKFGLKGDRLSSLCYQATRKHYAIENTTSALKKIVKFPVFILSKCIGKNYFQNKLSDLAGVTNYEHSNFVGCVVWLSGGAKDIFPRQWFDEYVLLTFGSEKFRAPKEYDALLKHIYGDYMQLPPEKDRIGHHSYKAYEK